MRSKKAWIRIVEAFIAIMIIAGVLVVAISRQNLNPDVSSEIYKKQRFILEQIADDKGLRENILNYDTEYDMSLEEGQNGYDAEKYNANIGTINGIKTGKINTQIPGHWEYEIKICPVNDVCGMDDYTERDVYVQERIIASTLEIYAPKKLRFFVWLK